MRTLLLDVCKNAGLPLPFLLLLVFAIPGFTHAETEVQGEVSGVWDVDGSPYLVLDTLYIPEGDTLQIEPGVTVEFQDQSPENRTPFNIYGALLALGEESDSIIFSSPEAAFSGFVLGDDDDPQSDPRLVLEYCVVDSVQQCIDAVDGIVAIINCLVMNTGGIFYSNEYGSDSLSYSSIFDLDNPQNTLAGYIENSSDLSLSNNLAEHLSIHLDFCIAAEIFANTLDNIYLQYSSVIVSGSIITGLSSFASSYSLADCDITTNIVSASDETITVTESSLSGLNFLDPVSATIQGNHFKYGSGFIVTSGGTFSIERNILRRLTLNNHTDASVKNNTFHYSDVGVVGSHWENASINQNIFVDIDAPSPAIQLVDGAAPEGIRYNCFFGMSVEAEGCEIGLGNIIEDPRLRGGDPIEYGLQANSPCIDGGDPFSENDPDGTRADIGALFFDQTVNHPPCLNITKIGFFQNGAIFQCSVSATDESGPVLISPGPLPHWLELNRSDLDWMSDTLHFSGVIPQGQEDFSFPIFAFDNSGLSDTAIVHVSVDPRTILQGEISGTLSAANSPYLVVGDILVTDEETLLIEPGTVLQFLSEDIPDYPLSLTVNGILIAEGTETDSIILTGDHDDMSDEFWDGIFMQALDDTASMRFVRINQSNQGITITDQSTLLVSNSLFTDNNDQAFFVNNGSSLYVDSSSFIDHNNSFNFIRSNASHSEIINSYFSSPNDEYVFAHLSIYNNSNVYIYNNVFTDGGYCNIDNNSNCTILNNVFYFLEYGLELVNASGIVANNYFAHCGDQGYGGSILLYPDSLSIFNNIFYSNRSAIRLFNYIDFPNDPPIRNNLFLDNNMPLVTLFGNMDLPSISYNSFFENDTITINTTINDTNLFVNPEISDTIDFYLLDNSPLIDAGHPAEEYYDLDGSRNDIGLWGGPYSVAENPGIYDVDDLTLRLPNDFVFYSPYPNPFNDQQNLRFYLPNIDAKLSIKIYNIEGRLVDSISLSGANIGYNTLIWKPNGLSSGVYFFDIRFGKHTVTFKSLLLH